MARVIMEGPPPCGEDCGWCVLCISEVKMRHFQASQERIKAGQASPMAMVRVPWQAILTAALQPGRYRGIAGGAAHLGVIDGLCWDHIAGLQSMHQTGLLDGQGNQATYRGGAPN